MKKWNYFGEDGAMKKGWVTVGNKKYYLNPSDGYRVTYMQNIENTISYDDRMDQLETNIYITTGLIEEYMYSYLYYEAGEMASIQKQIDFWLTIEILFVILVMVVVIPLVLSRAVKLSKSITDPIVAMKPTIRASRSFPPVSKTWRQDSTSRSNSTARSR